MLTTRFVQVFHFFQRLPPSTAQVPPEAFLVLWFCLNTWNQTYRARGAWLTHSSLRAFKRDGCMSRVSHDVQIRACLPEERRWAWPYQRTVIADPCVLRALPTVRPRWSNSAAVILSRSMIESLTRSFRAVAVLATAFVFFFANRL